MIDKKKTELKTSIHELKNELKLLIDKRNDITNKIHDSKEKLISMQFIEHFLRNINLECIHMMIKSKEIGIVLHDINFNKKQYLSLKFKTNFICLKNIYDCKNCEKIIRDRVKRKLEKKCSLLNSRCDQHGKNPG